MPSITRFIDGSGPVFAGPVFPFVCITIACGAVSGFHSLIASGTTPKMVARESRIRDIGYGAMVVEMMVALMAMIAACCARAGPILRDQQQGRTVRSRRQYFCGGISRDGSRHAGAGRQSRRDNDVRSRGRRADVCRRNGAHVLARLIKSNRDGALVSLRHHVRSAVSF